MQIMIIVTIEIKTINNIIVSITLNKLSINI
jgi:hypothetical protein